MNALNSFRATNTITTSTTKEGTSKEIDKGDYDLAQKRSHVVTIGDNGRITKTFYAYGGSQYNKQGSEKWLKSKVIGAGAYWLTEITEMSKDPESARVIQENSSTYELAINVKRQLVNLFTYGSINPSPQTIKNFNKKVQADVLNVQGLADLRKAVKKMNAHSVITVTKDTFYLKRANFKIDIKAYRDTGDLSMDIDINFYDFNKPVKIVLPKDAKSASGK